MPPINPPEPAMSADTRTRLQQLAQALLQHYGIVEPPVPVERMLHDPAHGLWNADPNLISVIIGHGLYRYAPRLAQARLLYRAISDSPAARHAGFEAAWPATRREIKYFARCLLMPEDWVRALPEGTGTPDLMSERFQVTPFDALIRLAELGLPVPDKSSIELE